jgi:16S rRNA (guanine527-N7)-methyltransferase
MREERFRARVTYLADAAYVVRPTEVELDAFWRYYLLLERWNAKINLTALSLGDLPDATINRLFIEPLTASQVVGDLKLDWMDLGSGGGSPAIPLKVVRPNLRLVMVEAKSRKAAFLAEVIRDVDLSDARVLCNRIEDLLPAYIERADLVTTRGVFIDETRSKTAVAFLRPGGAWLAFGGPEQIPGVAPRSVHNLPGVEGNVLRVFQRHQ